MALKKTDLVRKREGPTGGIGAQLRPIGVIRSTIKKRGQAPMQGSEGAPDAWLEMKSFAAQGVDGLAAGGDIIVITWLHQGRRDVLKVYPRSDRSNPLTGVFATRSPDRPNPLGLHRVTVRKIYGNRLRIGPIEAIDGTPVVDIKPALAGVKRFLAHYGPPESASVGSLTESFRPGESFSGRNFDDDGFTYLEW